MSLEPNRKNQAIILSFILSLGLYLRLYHFKERFYWGLEQSAATWPIVKFLTTGKPPLIGLHLFSLKSGLFRPPFYIYLYALPLKIFSFKPLGLGIVFSLTSLLVIYWLIKAGQIIFKPKNQKINQKNQKIALLAGFVYATNFWLIKLDKTVWTMTPIIITSTLILWLLAKIFSTSQAKSQPAKTALILGLITGLGFSFHFQLALSLISISLLFLSRRRFKLWLAFLAGVLLMLSPLLIFNLRHDFLMVRGALKILQGQEIITAQTTSFWQRLNNGLQPFTDLSFKMLSLPTRQFNLSQNLIVFTLLFLGPGLLAYCQAKKPAKAIASYFLITGLLSLISLTLMNQGYYQSNALYIFLFIPMLIIFWLNTLKSLLKSQFLLFSLVLVFTGLNLKLWFNQPAGSYPKKMAIVNYLCQQIKNQSQDQASIKFINQDVLSFDYLFFFKAPAYNLDFNQFNLMEEWQPGQADFYLIQGNYDWQEDQYQLKPYCQKTSFGEIEVIEKAGCR